MKNTLILLLLGLFAELSAQTVTITAPNGGETLTRGSQQTITWTKDGFTENVKIELYKNGTLFNVIAESAAETSFNWTVPVNTAGSDYKIKVTSVSAIFINDYSDNNCTIIPGSITAIAPADGDTLNLGMQYEIKWSNTSTNDPVKIGLYKSGVLSSIISNNAGATGSLAWTPLPGSLPAAGAYQIKISSKGLSEVNCTVNFSIKGTLVNGGYISGTWQSSGSPYVIAAESTVRAGYTLEIKAGTKVVALDTLKVRGTLLANGLLPPNQIENYAPVKVVGGSALLQSCFFSGNKTWDKTFNESANSYDGANSIVRTTDGGYALAGYTSSNALVIKLDANGNKIWDKTFNGSANSIVQTADGGYAVAGGTYVYKLDAAGNQSWSKTVNGNIYSIIQTGDGGFALAGYLSNSYNFDVWVLKLDASGNKTWDKTFNGAANADDGANSIVQTADGGYAIAGYTKNSLYKSDAWVFKLDASGNKIWDRKFSGAGNNSDRANSIVQTADGGYALAGYICTSSGFNGFWVFKLDASGYKTWDYAFNNATNTHDYANSIVQTTDGGYTIAGYSDSYAGTENVWVLKLDASGYKKWDRTFNGTANADDCANSIVQTVDGGYAVAGFTKNSTSDRDVWVLKLSTNGDLYSNKIIMQNTNTNSYLQNCIFTDSGKSAIRLENSSPAITNCTFSKNSGDLGGAIYASGNSTPKITNSIFWGNKATTGKQIYLDGTTAKPEFRYNLIEGSYLAIGLGNGAALGEIWEGNKTTDPLFIDTVSYKIGDNSPAYNSGTPDITGLNLSAYDLWGNARVAFNRIDIGAYEVPDPSDISNNLINDWNLSQNYPNPFNPQTTINYTIKDGFNGLVKLKIYNAKGEVVQTITNNVAKAGHYSQVFNGSNFSSGIYYYGIEAGDFKQMKKMVMVK